MSKTAKPAWTGRASQQTKTSKCLKNNTNPTAKQALPIPGTAFTAFLKKFRLELLACEMTREVSAALDCVDYLLDLVEREVRK